MALNNSLLLLKRNANLDGIPVGISSMRRFLDG
jgi:hypothetical protein